MRRASKAVMRRGGHGSQVRPTSGRQFVHLQMRITGGRTDCKLSLSYIVQKVRAPTKVERREGREGGHHCIAN